MNSENGILFVTMRRIATNDDSPTSRSRPIFSLKPLRDARRRINHELRHGLLETIVLLELGRAGLVVGFSIATVRFGDEILFASAPSISEPAPSFKTTCSDWWTTFCLQKILGWLLVKQNLNLCPYLKQAAHLSAEKQFTLLWLRLRQRVQPPRRQARLTTSVIVTELISDLKIEYWIPETSEPSESNCRRGYSGAASELELTWRSVWSREQSFLRIPSTDLFHARAKIKWIREIQIKRTNLDDRPNLQWPWFNNRRALNEPENEPFWMKIC